VRREPQRDQIPIHVVQEEEPLQLRTDRVLAGVAVGGAKWATCSPTPARTAALRNDLVTSDVSSSVPAPQSLDKSAGEGGTTLGKGTQGTLVRHYEPALVRGYARAHLPVHSCSWLIIADPSPYGPLQVAHCASDLRRYAGAVVRGQRAAAGGCVPAASWRVGGCSRLGGVLLGEKPGLAHGHAQAPVPCRAAGHTSADYANHGPSSHSQFGLLPRRLCRGTAQGTVGTGKAHRPPRGGAAACHRPRVLDSLPKHSPYSPLGPSLQHAVTAPVGPARD
jgi:hypothetical protein